jgi:hypothetical protein
MGPEQILPVLQLFHGVTVRIADHSSRDMEKVSGGRQRLTVYMVPGDGRLETNLPKWIEKP